MSKQTAPKLADIAQRIAAHLNRIEMAQPDRGKSSCRYWHANAWPAGSRLGIRYVSYQHTYTLRKADALEYLAWLDAGNDGPHHKALNFNTRMEALRTAAKSAQSDAAS